MAYAHQKHTGGRDRRGAATGAGLTTGADILAARVVACLFAWRSVSATRLMAALAIVPFVVAAASAPGLLSVAPIIDLMSPLAEAKAVAAGAASLKSAEAPLFTVLLLLADRFSATPGEAYLAAKAIAGGVVGVVFALIASRRLPTGWVVCASAALAAYAAAPFTSRADLALALFLPYALLVFTAPSIDSIPRALRSGALAGALLFSLWIASPAFALVGVAALLACPFLTGGYGVWRYGAALGGFCAILVVSELMAPGLFGERLAALTALRPFDPPAAPAGALNGSVAGVGVGALILLIAIATFGGEKAWRGWAGAAAFLGLSLLAARASGARTEPAFVAAVGMAVLSTASPLYAGVFRQPDRAVIALAGTAASLAYFWTIAIAFDAAAQISVQARAGRDAPADILAAFGVAQQGDATIARWIAEGRFTTAEARELFEIQPMDQSAILLDAAARTRAFASGGVDVAILTSVDAACVLALSRKCHADGRKAADAASVVFAPRLDLDKATAEINDRAEALLYTEFKLAEQTLFWDVWVRRGASVPALNSETAKVLGSP